MLMRCDVFRSAPAHMFWVCKRATWFQFHMLYLFHPVRYGNDYKVTFKRSAAASFKEKLFSLSKYRFIAYFISHKSGP